MNIIRVSESLSPRTSDQTYQSFFSSIFPIFHPLRDINFGALSDEYGCWGDDGGSIFHRSRRPDPENLEAQCISVVCRRSILSTKLLPNPRVSTCIYCHYCDVADIVYSDLRSGELEDHCCCHEL